MSDAGSRALVVLGGGPGGYVAAIRAAQLGVATTLVEEANLGGVCLNEGCVPSKALIHDAGAVAADAALGLIGPAEIADRFGTSHARRGIAIGRLRRGVAGLLRSNGVTTVGGRGTIVDPHHLAVVAEGESHELRFDDLIVATGSEVIVPAGLEVDGSFVLTARDVLALDRVPGRAVVVGGGYIGLELASALHRFGTEVVVVEATGRLLSGIDATIAEHLRGSLDRDGLDIRLDCRVTDAADGSVTIVDAAGATTSVDADVVVVAVGRRPRTAGIGLDAAGVGVTESGHITVDDRLRTDVAHVRAIGDVTPGPALAHRAMAQGRVAAEAIAGRPATFRPAAVPAVVFTTPEVATVGFGLAEAAELGFDAREVRFPLAANARGLTMSSDGFGLLVYDGPSGLVLGAHLVGPGVGEMIGTMTLAIEMGAVLDDLAGTIFPHPTISEMFAELADAGLGVPIHTASAITRSPADASAE